MKQLIETDTTMKERFGKWAILILHYLEDGPVRFNELQRLMPKMTHATLSVQLKSLVEYSLTEIGKKFHPVIEALKTWGEEYIEYLGARD